ncbi:MAG TPA: hypothetical protein VEK08_11265 [Planctomycetota bacterium]|nr:hypothetical protein [Planctomycetota bacterium]
MPKTKKNFARSREGQEKKSKEQHDQRTGKATAADSDVRHARKIGTATTPPRTGAKSRANRDRSDNKKVQSGR